MADDRAVGEPERLHPFFLLTGLGGALRGIAGGYAFIAYLAVSGRLGTALIAAAALFVFMAVGLFLYWRRFEFRVGVSEIRIDSGILSRTHRSIPFDRVQDVDISQGPVARLLGLAKVKFETGGSAGEEEGVLQAIPLGRAQQLRELVRSRRTGAAALSPTEPQEDQGRPPVYAMDLRRLLLAGLFNFSLALFAGLFGLSQTVGDVIGFDPFSRSFWNSMLSASEPVQRFVMEHRAVTIFAGALSLVLVGAATGIVRTALRDYGFRLDRTDIGLRRRRGLINLTDVTLPVRRAQAAIVATGPVRELFGWRELRLQSLARDEGGSGDHVLAPLATEAEVATVLSQLGWRPVPPGTEWRRVSSAYVWVRLIALTPLYLLLLAQGLVLAWTWTAIEPVTLPYVLPELAPLLFIFLAVFVLVVALVAGRWLAWLRTGYAIDGDRLLIRTGWWRRRLLVLPFAKIQSVDIVQSFISRWFGTATMVFGIAGGTTFSSNAIPSLRAEIARDLRARLLSPPA